MNKYYLLHKRTTDDVFTATIANSQNIAFLGKSIAWDYNKRKAVYFCGNQRTRIYQRIVRHILQELSDTYYL